MRLFALQEPASKNEKKYRKILSGVELTKNFFFSYTWPTWRTVQAALTCPDNDNPWDNMFVWNDYLTRCATLEFGYLLRQLRLRPGEICSSCILMLPSEK